jgi:hypothetical protein
MKRPLKILTAYLLGLLLCSLVFEYLGIINYLNTFDDSKTSLLNPMLLLTVFGGIFVLRLLVSRMAFKAFLLGYSLLWAIRFLLLYVAPKIGTVYLMGKSYRFDIIIPHYFSFVSRLSTPLPFVIYWILYYLFDKSRRNAQSDDMAEKIG